MKISNTIIPAPRAVRVQLGEVRLGHRGNGSGTEASETADTGAADDTEQLRTPTTRWMRMRMRVLWRSASTRISSRRQPVTFTSSTSSTATVCPEGFGPVLIPYLDYQLLLAVDVVDGEYTAQLAHTATESDSQDFCIETPERTAPRLWMRAQPIPSVSRSPIKGEHPYTINRFVPTNPEELGFSIDSETAPSPASASHSN